MTTATRPLRIGIVAGEESGDILAADLIRALAARAGRPVELVGVGGPHLAALGLKSLFDPDEIALMGVTAILARLPKLVMRIGETARAIAAAKPDLVLTVDSPEFSLRVARKTRALCGAPVVHYVCPSVWAWRSGRARDMAGFVDKVLCILPFEIAELERLGGPPGVYVGHRLASDPAILAARAAQRSKRRSAHDAKARILVLPGSRRSEVRALLPAFRETFDILAARGSLFSLVLPTVPRVAALVEEGTRDWPQRPEILLDPDGKYRAFGEADAAIAASGTVSLELALARVPSIVCYRTDSIVRFAVPWIRIWSASLPNLVSDRPVLPEFYDSLIRPGMLARHLELLLKDGPVRTAQLEGFDAVEAAMTTDRAAGEIGAEAILDLVERSKGGRQVSPPPASF